MDALELHETLQNFDSDSEDEELNELADKFFSGCPEAVIMQDIQLLVAIARENVPDRTHFRMALDALFP